MPKEKSGNGSFPGLNFHITDEEIEPAVLKEIPPPLYKVNSFRIELRVCKVPGVFYISQDI